jgi:hypothetical protein
MSNINTGGPAFPQYAWNEMAEKFTATEGMTLRDYFAAKAMQALLSNVEAGNEHQVVLIPNIAYELADDMLRERKV